MTVRPEHEFLFIGKDDNSFLDHYNYGAAEDNGPKEGQLFVNLEIQNNPVDAQEISAAMFEAMHRVFYEDTNLDPYDRFERGLKEVNNLLKDFKDKKFSGYAGNLNIVIAAVVDNHLYLTQCGDAEVYLIRKRFVSNISDGLNEEESDDIFVNIASGELMPGDFVVLSSTRLLRYISQTDLAKSVNPRDIKGSLEEIKDIISTEILGRIGLTGVMMHQASEPAAAPEEGDVREATIEQLEKGEVKMEEEDAGGEWDGGASVSEAPRKSFSRDRKRKRGGAALKGAAGTLGRWFQYVYRGIFSKGFGKDKILALLVLVIVVLVVSIWVAKSQSAVRAQLQDLDDLLVGVQDKLAEAETRGAFDKETAKSALDSAYEDAMQVLNSGYYREKAKLLLIQIDDARDGLDNVNRIENPKVLADLSEKRSDVNALGLVEVNDRIFAYEYNALYELVLDQVQDPITIDDDESVIAATGFDDRGSVVFMTKSGKLIEYRDGAISFMDTADVTFRPGVALDDWSNRIYILDPDESQIWRYTFSGARESFGSAEAYLADNSAVDLSNASDIAIDASVYVLAGSDIEKFYAGAEAEFFINNPPLNFIKDPAALYTDEKLGEVYVADGSESKIFVYKKDELNGNLEYSAQYLFDGVDEIRDVYVDADTRKMYVLSADKVYELDV